MWNVSLLLAITGTKNYMDLRLQQTGNKLDCQLTDHKDPYIGSKLKNKFLKYMNAVWDQFFKTRKSKINQNITETKEQV